MANHATGNTSIKSFFSKAPTAQVAIGTATSLSSSLVHATTSTKPSDPPSVLSTPVPDSHLPQITTTPHTPAQLPLSPKSPLLAKLKAIISTLPDSVVTGTKEDDLAQFSGDPIHEVDEGEDAWEMIDRALNRVIGYGKTATEIENVIRRGRYGMDGMFSWLEKCIYELKIDEGLLENKVERMIGAMLQL